MKKLEGKVAVITGGASGIGKASATLFAAEGARVVIISTRYETVDAAVKEIGGNAIGFAGDVSNLGDLDRIYAKVSHEVGKIDILFANAGVGTFEALGTVSEESFDRQFDINVKGLFFSVQKALPLFNDGGAILLNSSVAHFMGNAGQHVYASTKAAVRSFARNWTVDLKDRKIRVNCISPALIDTPILAKGGISRESALEFLAPLLHQMPLGRLGSADEAARAALFLVSDDSSFITGSDLCVDGGLGQI